MRKNQKQSRRNDMVDMMIDILDETTDANTEDDFGDEQFEKDSRLELSKVKRPGMDESYIMATALVIMVAGKQKTHMLSF